MLKDELIELLNKEKVKGAFVIGDLNLKTKISYNADVVVPSASLIKVFILIRVFQEIMDGKITFEEEILCKKDDIVPFSVLEYLCPRKYKLYELVNVMMIYSDNTATNILIDYFGFEKINDTIREMGCERSILQRKMMDFVAAKEGYQNYTCAQDMFSVFEKIEGMNLLGAQSDKQMIEILKKKAGECVMKRYLPDEIEIASKGGELDGLNHDVAVVYGEKGKYIFAFFIWDAADCVKSREVLAHASKITYDYFQTKNGRAL